MDNNLLLGACRDFQEAVVVVMVGHTNINVCKFPCTSQLTRIKDTLTTNPREALRSLPEADYW